MNMTKCREWAMVATLVGFASVAWSGEPDFLADKIVSDGIGLIDTGCRYLNGKTSRVKMCYQTKSKGWDLPTQNKERRCLFAIWPTSGSNRSVACYTAEGHLQVWGNDGDLKDHYTDYAMKGDCSVEVDYRNGTYEWLQAGATGSRAGEIKPLTADSSFSYDLFGWQLGAGGRAAVTMTEFCIYEKGAEDEVETLAHEFVPCCKDGRAALYDTKTTAIVFPTSDGFELVGDYSLSVGNGKTLVVTSVSCNPESLSFAGSARVVFDGLATLSPAAIAVLPTSGKITVDLLEMRGKGRYVLMENLPSGFDLGLFEVGALPADCTGVLSKVGASLVLTLTGGSRFWPEAIGGTLTSDAHGHVDTGYKFVCTKFPKTSRVTLDFNTTNQAVGSATGPHVDASSTRSVFGFISEAQMVSYARWARTTPTVWGGGWAKWEGSPVSGDDSIEIDYLHGKVSWGTHKGGALAVGTLDSAYSYWLFDWNYRANAGYNPQPCVYDLRRFRIYETADGATESLVHDFIPCVSDGRPALYDWQTGAVKYPAADTNGFVSTSSDWRVRVNAETIYRAAGSDVSIACGASETADGFVIRRDADGGVLARGVGNVASFAMPAEAVTVDWTYDIDVAEGETLTVDGLLACNVLTLAAGARIEFVAGGVIALSTGLVLPAAAVKVGFSSARFPGVYTLMSGVAASVVPTSFELVSVPAGMIGFIERHDDRIVLRLSEDVSSPVGIVGETLTTDKRGWIDTGYLYKAKAYPRTTRVSFDFLTANYGALPDEKATKSLSLFGYLSTGTDISYCRYEGNDSTIVNTQVWSGNSTKSYGLLNCGTPNGAQSIQLDYANGKVTWRGIEYAKDFYPSEKDSARSYWIAGVNGNNAPSYMEIHSFKAWEVTEGGAETLACDIVPTLKAGQPGAYDRVSGRFIPPTYNEDVPNGFAVGFGCVSQEFAVARTACGATFVETPAFAPQNAFTFRADGWIAAKTAIQSLVMTGYDAAGNVVSTTTVTPVVTGREYAVELGEASRVVVRAVGADAGGSGGIAQSFLMAEVLGAAEVFERQAGKHEFEYMVLGSATMTFKADVDSVRADLYDASGAKVGEETLAGAIGAGESLEIAAPETAAYRIVRVSFGRPGLMLFVR